MFVEVCRRGLKVYCKSVVLGGREGLECEIRVNLGLYESCKDVAERG